MVNFNTMKNLYEKVLADKILTTEELMDCGFDLLDIPILISLGHIKENDDGNYKFINFQCLNDYYKRTHKNDKDKVSFYKKILEIDPYNQDYFNELFLDSLIENNYDELINLYLTSPVVKAPERKHFWDFCLLILGNVTILPEELKDYVSKLSLNDFMLEFTDEDFSNMFNKVAKDVFYKKFSHAFQLFNDYAVSRKLSTYQSIIRALLGDAANASGSFKNEVSDAIKNGNYEEVFNLLSSREESYGLSTFEKYISILARDYISIRDTRVIPTIESYNSYHLYDAIDAHDYKTALEINSNNRYSSSPEMVSLILNDICKLIENIKSESVNNTILDKKHSKAPFTVLSAIKKFLNDKSLDDAFIVIKNYLKGINKEEFYLLCVYLIRLDSLNIDIDFTNFSSELKALGGDYSFDCTKYIDLFNQYIEKGSIYQAMVCLDIILKYGPDEVIKELRLNINEKDNRYDESLLLEEYVKQIHDDVVSGEGMSLVDSLDGFDIQACMDKLKTYDDLFCFKIEDEDRERICVNYRNPSFYADTAKCFTLSKELYVRGDYAKARDTLMLLLKTFDYPNAYLYTSLGRCYMRMNDIDNAIDYFTVGNYIDKVRSLKEYDCSKTILKLKALKNTKCYYGIENFDGIKDIILSSCDSIEETCKKLNIDKSQIDIIKLLCAREYYKVGDITNGDKILLTVNRNELTNDIFDEIDKYRIYYYNGSNFRPKSKSRSLSNKK